MEQRLRKRYTIAGAEFSAPAPIGQAIYAQLRENVHDDCRALGATEQQLDDDVEWLKWLTVLLKKKQTLGGLRILESMLRPESGVSVRDAYEADTRGEAGAPINFFSENMKRLLKEKGVSIESLPSTRKGKTKRKP